MKYIKDNPKQGTWELFKILESGIVLSGYSSIGLRYINYSIDEIWDEDKGEMLIMKKWHDSEPIPVECVPNFIFEATIIPVEVSKGRSSVIYRFDDAEDLHTYESSVTGVLALLQGISDGTVTVSHGVGYRALWTFKKQGSTISIVPWSKA